LNALYDLDHVFLRKIIIIRVNLKTDNNVSCCRETARRSESVETLSTRNCVRKDLQQVNDFEDHTRSWEMALVDRT